MIHDMRSNHRSEIHDYQNRSFLPPSEEVPITREGIEQRIADGRVSCGLPGEDQEPESR